MATLLLQKIFKDGEHMEWDDDIQERFAVSIGMPEEVINSILISFLKYEIFDRSELLYNGILTSNRIKTDAEKMRRAAKRVGSSKVRRKNNGLPDLDMRKIEKIYNVEMSRKLMDLFRKWKLSRKRSLSMLQAIENKKMKNPIGFCERNKP